MLRLSGAWQETVKVPQHAPGTIPTGTSKYTTMFWVFLGSIVGMNPFTTKQGLLTCGFKRAALKSRVAARPPSLGMVASGNAAIRDVA